MAPDLSTTTVSAYAFLAMALAGGIALPFFAPLQQPDSVEWGMFLCTVILGGLAYVAVVIATRTGDIGAIAPFRYSRLIFAIIIAVIFLGERPDMPTMIGASVIVASGVYAFWRERLRAAMETPA
jgi:drug/metabolite transporter (DMT)-like permease